MQRKAELLKWIPSLLIVLIVIEVSFLLPIQGGGIAFSRTFLRADDSSNSASATSSGSNNSLSCEAGAPSGTRSPTDFCNTNTAPQSGNCELAWIDGGGGSTTLVTSGVTDPGLQATLSGQSQQGMVAQGPGYNLWCVPNETSCTLMPSSSNNGINGNPNLYLGNIYVSPWVQNKLLNQYNLDCNGGCGSGSSNSSGNSSSIGSTTNTFNDSGGSSSGSGSSSGDCSGSGSSGGSSSDDSNTSTSGQKSTLPQGDCEFARGGPVKLDTSQVTDATLKTDLGPYQLLCNLDSTPHSCQLLNGSPPSTSTDTNPILYLDNLTDSALGGLIRSDQYEKLQCQ